MTQQINGLGVNADNFDLNRFLEGLRSGNPQSDGYIQFVTRSIGMDPNQVAQAQAAYQASGIEVTPDGKKVYRAKVLNEAVSSSVQDGPPEQANSQNGRRIPRGFAQSQPDSSDLIEMENGERITIAQAQKDFKAQIDAGNVAGVEAFNRENKAFQVDTKTGEVFVYSAQPGRTAPSTSAPPTTSAQTASGARTVAGGQGAQGSGNGAHVGAQTASGQQVSQNAVDSGLSFTGRMNGTLIGGGSGALIGGLAGFFTFGPVGAIVGAMGGASLGSSTGGAIGAASDASHNAKVMTGSLGGLGNMLGGSGGADLASLGGVAGIAGLLGGGSEGLSFQLKKQAKAMLHDVGDTSMIAMLNNPGIPIEDLIFLFMAYMNDKYEDRLREKMEEAALAEKLERQREMRMDRARMLSGVISAFGVAGGPAAAIAGGVGTAIMTGTQFQNSLESAINGGGKSSTLLMSEVQVLMHKWKQITEMMSNMLKSIHDMAMSIIRNQKV